MSCTQLPLLLRRTRLHPLGIGYAIQHGKDWCQAPPQELRAIWAKVVHVLDVTDFAHMLSRKAVKRTKSVNSTGRHSRTELNDRSGNGGHTSPVPKSALHVGLPLLLLNLQKVEGTPANSIVVDMSRVTELRQAIREGHFNVDVNKVADRLVESARWMLSAHPLKE